MGGMGGQGMGWGFVFVGPGVGHLIDLVLPAEGIFESFFPTRTKKTETEHMFPASLFPRFTHAPYGLKRSGSHGGQ